jgi:hypothetical protein
MATPNPKVNPQPQPAPPPAPTSAPAHKSVYRKIIEELGLDAGVSAIVFALFKQFGKDTIVVLAENFWMQTHKSLEDHRGELMRDVLLLGPDSRAKFFGWYEKIKNEDKNKEKDFIMLLCKLPKDKDGSRVYVLDKICALTDQEIEDLLSALDHDNLKQFVMQVANRIPGFFRNECDDLGTSAGNVATTIFGGLQAIARHINRGMVESAPAAQSLIDWFDEH